MVTVTKPLEDQVRIMAGLSQCPQVRYSIKTIRRTQFNYVQNSDLRMNRSTNSAMVIT